ncbi:MAG: WG repeat-containing protein [Planctomycetota bacterium]|nr:WG repeat-containing protein [Planctomycetota bacterium]
MKKVILLFALAIILGASYFTISSVLDRPYLTVYNPHDFSGIDRDNYGMCECLLIEGSTHVEIYSLNGKKIKGKNEQVEVHYNPLNKTFAASVNGEWGLFDKNGEEIVQPEYKSCAFYPFSSYVFLLAFDGELAVFDDDFGKVLFTKPVRMLRDVSCLTQSQESKWFFLADDDVGLMNHAGNEVFRTEGTSRSNVTSTGNVVVVKKDNVEFYDSTFSVIGERSLQNVKYRDIGLTQNEMLKKKMVMSNL